MLPPIHNNPDVVFLMDVPEALVKQAKELLEKKGNTIMPFGPLMFVVPSLEYFGMTFIAFRMTPGGQIFFYLHHPLKKEE